VPFREQAEHGLIVTVGDKARVVGVTKRVGPIGEQALVLTGIEPCLTEILSKT
jgi:hypothetical protein